MSDTSPRAPRSLLALLAGLGVALLLPLGACSGGDGVTCTPAAELCNGRDDDCDGQVDDGFDAGAACTAGVGACQASGHKVCTSSGAGTICDVTPGTPGTETCNGLDDDCDGSVDEGLADCCVPAATRACGAGAGVCAAGTQTCSAARAWGECLDGGGAPVIVPGAQVESCNGLDDDCDGEVDEVNASDCTLFLRDADQDGFGLEAICACGPTGQFTATQGGDCDDANPQVHPGATEVCNGIDDDCDLQVDEGIPASGSCTAGVGACQAAGTFVCQGGTLTCSATPLTPGAEVCNGLDDDCNGAVDDGLTGLTCYTGPPATLGVGACHGGTRSCVGGTFTTCQGEVLPRPETCNGVDDDCDGVVDEADATGCVNYYVDADRDGFGTGAAACLCAPSGNRSATVAGDCNDASAAVHPGAAEVCNGLDDDCDALIDPEDTTGCTSFYADQDRDGYGAGAAHCLCAATGQFGASQNGDCNDTNAAVHPGAVELCNAVDDNCDGRIDEFVTRACPLQVGVCAGSTVACVGGAFPACGAAQYGPDYSPVELICDFLDNNCNGQVDENNPPICP